MDGSGGWRGIAAVLAVRLLTDLADLAFRILTYLAVHLIGIRALRPLSHAVGTGAERGARLAGAHVVWHLW